MCIRYRDRFNEKEVPGGHSGGAEGEDKGPYCRVIKNLDCSKDSECDKLFDIIGSGVMKHVASRVTVEGTVVDDSPAEAGNAAFLKIVHGTGSQALRGAALHTELARYDAKGLRRTTTLRARRRSQKSLRYYEKSDTYDQPANRRQKKRRQNHPHADGTFGRCSCPP